MTSAAQSPTAGVQVAEEDVRITIRLSPAAKLAVEEIMKLGDFPTIQEAVRRAIADERYLQKKISEGWTVLLNKDNEYRQLVWPG